MKELNINDLTNVIGGAELGEVQNTYYPPERSPVRKYAATGNWVRLKCHKCKSLDINYIVVGDHSVMMCRDCGSIVV